MSKPEHFDVIILGSGLGGKLLAWNLADAGKKDCGGGTSMGRRLVPHRCSKNEIWSARVAHLADQQHGRACASPSSFNRGRTHEPALIFHVGTLPSYAFPIWMRVAVPPPQEAV